jgi:hypothetical protein
MFMISAYLEKVLTHSKIIPVSRELLANSAAKRGTLRGLLEIFYDMNAGRFLVTTGYMEATHL